MTDPARAVTLLVAGLVFAAACGLVLVGMSDAAAAAGHGAGRPGSIAALGGLAAPFVVGAVGGLGISLVGLGRTVLPRLPGHG